MRGHALQRAQPLRGVGSGEGEGRGLWSVFGAMLRPAMVTPAMVSPAMVSPAMVSMRDSTGATVVPAGGGWGVRHKA